MSASAAACSWLLSAVPSIAAMIRSVGALGDHLVDLLGLGRDVVARVLQVDLVALVLQLGLDGVAVGDPALRGLGRHRDADREVLGVGAARRCRSRCPAPRHHRPPAPAPERRSAAVKPSFLLTVISSSRHLPPLDPAQARGCASGPNVSANNAARQPLLALSLSRSRNPHVIRVHATRSRGRADTPRDGACESAQRDLPGEQAGPGAPLVGGERLGHGQRLLEAGLELRRRARPSPRPGCRRQVPHRDDETERAEGAGVPGALAEQDLLRTPTAGPARRAASPPAPAAPSAGGRARCSAAPSRRRPGPASRTVGRIASLACSSPASAAALGVGALQPEPEVVVDDDVERRGRGRAAPAAAGPAEPAAPIGPGSTGAPAGASSAAASAVPMSRLTSSEDVCIWTPSTISPLARTSAGRAAGQHAGQGHVPAVRRPQRRRRRRHQLAQRHPVGLARQPLERPGHRRRVARAVAVLVAAAGAARARGLRVDRPPARRRQGRRSACGRPCPAAYGGRALRRAPRDAAVGA